MYLAYVISNESESTHTVAMLRFELSMTAHHQPIPYVHIAYTYIHYYNTKLLVWYRYVNNNVPLCVGRSKGNAELQVTTRMYPRKEGYK